MSTTNQSSLENIPILELLFTPSDTSLDYSAQFSPSPSHSPSEWHPSTYDFRSQPIPQVERNPQLDVPLLHPDTELPITLDLQKEPVSQTATSIQVESESHAQATPIPQSAMAQNHPLSSPNVSQTPLPELPLHLLPQAEEELDLERLEECLQRLQGANKRLEREAPQHVEVANTIAIEIGIGNARIPEQVPILNKLRTQELRQTKGGSMEEVIIQSCSGDTVGSRNLTHDNSPPGESAQEELVHAHAEEVEGREEIAVVAQKEELPAEQNDTTHSPRVLDDETHSNDLIPIQVQLNDSSAYKNQGEPRPRGRKRRREDVETGHLLRSRKPPSSSKRTRIDSDHELGASLRHHI